MTLIVVPFYCACCGRSWMAEIRGKLSREVQYPCPFCGEMWAVEPDLLADNFPWEVLE